MASREEVISDLYDAVQSLTKEAKEAGSTRAEDYALAALHLAEAAAWIRMPNNSHAGGAAAAKSS
jgi:hypothetical protein